MSLMPPPLLVQKENREALEGLILDDARDLLARTRREKIIDSTKKVAFHPVLYNAVGGLFGFAAGGIDGAVETMKHVSTTIVPLTVGMVGLTEIVNNYVLGDIKSSIVKVRNEAVSVLRATQSKLYHGVAGLVGATLAAPITYGVSVIGEKLAGVDVNNWEMALVGSGASLAMLGVNNYKAKKWRARINERVEENKASTEHVSSTPMQYEDIENLVRGSIVNQDEAYKIFVSTQEKMFRGIGGALGFLGELDALKDEQRDSSRVKPNVTLMSGDSSIDINFNYDRTSTKTSKILDVVKVINAHVGGEALDIHPSFEKFSVEDFNNKPYEGLSNVTFKDDATFEVSYRFGRVDDEVEIKLFDRKSLPLVLDLYETITDKPLMNTDFDLRLLDLSVEPSEDAVYGSGIIGKVDMDTLLELDIDPSEFNITNKRDPLDTLRKPVSRRELFNFGLNMQEEKPTPEPLEPLTDDLDKVPAIVLEQYSKHKDSLRPSRGYDAIGVAFEGVFYSISPYNYDEPPNKLLYAALHPVKSARSTLSGGEVLPTVKRINLASQITGITRENVTDIVSDLDTKIKGFSVSPKLEHVDNTTFWEMSRNPAAIIENSYSVKCGDRHGTEIMLFFDTPTTSYGTIRSEQFPVGEALDRKIEEANIPPTDIASLFGGFGAKRRFEAEKENPSYFFVNENGDPGHLIMLDSDYSGDFMRQKTVVISTQENAFIDNLVHPKEGIDRVTRYLSHIRDSIEAVNGE